MNPNSQIKIKILSYKKSSTRDSVGDDWINFEVRNIVSELIIAETKNLATLQATRFTIQIRLIG